MTVRARRMVGNALVHVSCAIVGLTGGYYAVLIVQGWIAL